MKKIVKTLVAVLMVSLLFLVTACGASSYASKLEKKGYSVTYVEKSENNGVIQTAALQTANALVKTLGATKDNPLKYVVTASNADGETVTIWCFESSSDAKEVEKNVTNNEKYKSFYRTGNTIIVGTEQGVKDAK